MGDDHQPLLKGDGTKEALKVASIGPHPTQKNAYVRKDYGADGTVKNETVFRLKKDVDSRSLGINKFQYKVGNQVKTAYMTFRIVSEDPAHAHKWIHPGFQGVHAFREVEKWAESELDRMITDILSAQR